MYPHPLSLPHSPRTHRTVAVVQLDIVENIVEFFSIRPYSLFFYQKYILDDKEYLHILRQLLKIIVIIP